MRARTITLHHKTAEKLRRLKSDAEVDGAYRVARRIHAVLLNYSGTTSGGIADVLDSPRSAVSQWLRNYERHGYEGLLEGYRSGRPPRLNNRQHQVLCDIIESGPVAYGFLGGVWTSPMIAKVIELEFAVTYHPGHVRRLLNQLEFSFQRPKRILAKADSGKQDRWKRYTYPNLKKKPVPKTRP